jgi:hypothetical protein
MTATAPTAPSRVLLLATWIGSAAMATVAIFGNNASVQKLITELCDKALTNLYNRYIENPKLKEELADCQRVLGSLDRLFLAVNARSSSLLANANGVVKKSLIESGHKEWDLSSKKPEEATGDLMVI